MIRKTATELRLSGHEVITLLASALGIPLGAGTEMTAIFKDTVGQVYTFDSQVYELQNVKITWTEESGREHTTA